MTKFPEGKLLVATRNEGKLREIRELTSNLPISIVSLDDLGIEGNVIEDGSTFEANAVKKANYFAEKSGLATLADDSGLCVSILDGKPGVHSARYGGSRLSDAERRHLVITEMEKAEEKEGESYRHAYFKCVIALAVPGKLPQTFSDECWGEILFMERGENGFGYDPVFYYEQLGLTFAEMTAEQKNKVSHRGLALKRFIRFLNTGIPYKVTVSSKTRETKDKNSYLRREIIVYADGVGVSIKQTSEEQTKIELPSTSWGKPLDYMKKLSVALSFACRLTEQDEPHWQARVKRHAKQVRYEQPRGKKRVGQGSKVFAQIGITSA
jgi:XTP/dITP diphosphohydrolase